MDGVLLPPSTVIGQSTQTMLLTPAMCHIFATITTPLLFLVINLLTNFGGHYMSLSDKPPIKFFPLFIISEACSGYNLDWLFVKVQMKQLASCEV